MRMVVNEFDSESGEMKEIPNSELAKFHSREAELSGLHSRFVEAVEANVFTELEDIAGFLFDFYYTYSGAVFDNIHEEDLFEMLLFYGKYFFYQPQEYIEAMNMLPDTFPIYRGGSGTKDLVASGISWTTSKAIAEGYLREPNPILLRTNINREDVISANGFSHEVLLIPTALDYDLVESITLEV